MTSAEALELLEGPPGLSLQGQQTLTDPHGQAWVSSRLKKLPGPIWVWGDGFLWEAGAERQGGLLSSGPASARSPQPPPSTAHVQHPRA